MIPFNRPFLCGKETQYIRDAVESGKISGDGIFTGRCQAFFEQRYGIRKGLMTTSCTDALEMAAILARIEPGDEVIVPSFTFVSTANAFVLRGANIVFADSGVSNPNIDPSDLEGLVTARTRAIVPVHYAGIACDMDAILEIAARHDLMIIEDAAQGIEAYHRQRPLGAIGHLGTFSFHETKNVISGEGGLLAINDASLIIRAEIIREKGTNRTAFFRGEVDKYGWVDIGSSFLPSEIISAFLYAQLEQIEQIQTKRKGLWDHYYKGLQALESRYGVQMPYLPDYASNNAHMFYMVCRTLEERTRLIEHLARNNVMAVFHYQSLHRSDYYRDRHDGRVLANADRYSDCLVRLPMFYELDERQVEEIVQMILDFYGREG
jgi:dTDP-4-amino-4,6-dideoxygalactose transaminase